MNNKKLTIKLLPAMIALGMAAQAQAGITLYDKDDTTFSTDGMINAFYVQSDNDGRTQSRVKMGFLPNWIGFNFGKQTGDLKLGARSSFWVSINDSDVVRANNQGRGESLGTDTGIDVRQFYGTVDADWGQVLIGKDFGLFNRTNIMSDELLLGYGQTSDTLGLIDGGNVSFGNIGSGYTYPFPKAQITYRSPTKNGFQLAVGIFDPSKSDTDSSEETPRFEGELTYATNFDNVAVKGWLGGLYQSSDDPDGTDVNSIDSTGVSYGANVKFGDLSLTASGFQSEGIGSIASIDNLVVDESVELEGYLLQGSYTFGPNRVALSYGENEGQNGADFNYENTAVAWFYTVNSNLKLVAEYDKTEVTLASVEAEENDTVALGAVLTW
ncbi:MAG: porin [Oceanospirillales bacterium]|uniref:Putative porin n=1 Tax=Marinobacterium halophilum TaxID=267374 RepID=A0A2P8END0_9GAMM|nr:porin [Marinobacterium halophilum]MBR9828183.1 porin [Oceanospirillales bacterium]PSL10921.1 putative porin [Marinobacterium halophilum]